MTNPPREGDFVEIKGQIRTYNEIVDEKNKLNVVVFAKEIYKAKISDITENYIYLEGFLCKEPLKRTSPLGREICDMMLAVNRMYNKSDYIPCIAWGRNAGYAENSGLAPSLRLREEFKAGNTKRSLMTALPRCGRLLKYP